MSNRCLQLEPVEAPPAVLPKRRVRPPKQTSFDTGLQQPPQSQLPRKRERAHNHPLPSETQKAPTIAPRPVRIHYNIPDSQSNHHLRKIRDLKYYGHKLDFWDSERSEGIFVSYNYDDPLPFKGLFGHIWESDGGDYLTNHRSRPRTYPGEIVDLTSEDDEDDQTDVEAVLPLPGKKAQIVNFGQGHEQTPEQELNLEEQLWTPCSAP